MSRGYWLSPLGSPSLQMGLTHLLARFWAGFLPRSPSALSILDRIRVSVSEVGITFAALADGRAFDRAKPSPSDGSLANLTRFVGTSMPSMSTLSPQKLSVHQGMRTDTRHLLQILRPIIERVLILVVDNLSTLDRFARVRAEPHEMSPSNMRALDAE